MSSLTNSNPLVASGVLDDFLPRPKPAGSAIQTEAVRAEKAIIRQTAEERGFAIDNLATIVRASAITTGRPAKVIPFGCTSRT